MAHSSDEARTELLDAVRPYVQRSNIRAVGQDVLIAIYDRAGKKTAGNIILPETHDEDKFQGKVGLILSMGPLCRGEKFDDWFGGKPPKIGDWIGINIRDGFSFVIGKTVCRLVEWQYIRFLTDAPDQAM